MYIYNFTDTSYYLFPISMYLCIICFDCINIIIKLNNKLYAHKHVPVCF